jgi:hypothetical protein
MNKQELIDLLKHNQDRCVGTISFTTEQVIEWIERLEEPKPQEENLQKFEQIIYDAISQAVYEINSKDVIDHSSAEFSLSDNEIVLDDIEFSTSDLTDHISEYVKNAIEDFQQE